MVPVGNANNGLRRTQDGRGGNQRGRRCRGIVTQVEVQCCKAGKTPFMMTWLSVIPFRARPRGIRMARRLHILFLFVTGWLICYLISFLLIIKCPSNFSHCDLWYTWCPIHICTPIQEFITVTHVNCACPIFMGFQTWADLVIFDMTNFDIIIGMNWFSPTILC